MNASMTCSRGDPSNAHHSEMLSQWNSSVAPEKLALPTFSGPNLPPRDVSFSMLAVS